MMKHLDAELIEYIDTYILPQYEDFDAGHNVDHITKVINNSFKVLEYITENNILSKEEIEAIDHNMVYTIAAYHDIAMPLGRKMHHINSARMLKDDTSLWNFFEKEQMDIMSDAIEDHRASSKEEPRSIYGKIIAEADRDIDPPTIFKRAFLFREPGKAQPTFEEAYTRAIDHIREKYGEDGYMQLWLDYPDNVNGLHEVRRLLDSPQETREMLMKI